VKKPVKKSDKGPAPARPIAVSLIRFSGNEQRKGDSVRRQTADRDGWCERNGVPLDVTLSGCASAYKKDVNAILARFLEMIEEGRVPRGSYLIMENLDRLSRQDERKSLRQWLDILDAGVNIVQLHPETIFRHERSDMVDVMKAIIELSRGHSESAMKSVRSLANWARAVELAREGEVITRRLPAWVELTDTGLALVPERAATVGTIFQLAASGYGMSSIVKRLNADGVSAFGDRVVSTNDDGEPVGHQAAPGERYGCGQWRTSYVRQILKDRRALGEYQPRDAEGRAKGEVIPNYFPDVVTKDEFVKARAAVLARRLVPGRIGEGVANLFSGLLKSARDGSSYYVACRSEGGAVSRMLLNRSSIEGQGKAYTFPYHVFEAAILAKLQEIDPEEIEATPPASEVHALQHELAWIRGRRAELGLELARGNVAEIVEVLRHLAAREAELDVAISQSEDMVAVPRVDLWRTAQGLAATMESAEDQEGSRLRLRAALRRIVSEVRVLVVPRGRGRVAAVQMFFADDRPPRDYLIVFRPGWKGRNGARAATWKARSLAEVGEVGEIDLRQTASVARLEGRLQKIDPAALLALLVPGGTP
jgi:DNA invertase Pin-like site-specific DNA recombinase